MHYMDRSRDWILWLDDAQALYGDQKFWEDFVKVVGLSCVGVQFVISATHMLEGQQLSPVELSSARRLKQEELRISREEARILLRSPMGLPSHLQHETLEEVIINEWNGLVAAVRLSIDAIQSRFMKDLPAKPPSEEEIMQYYFSRDFLPEVNRCFGSRQSTPVDTVS
ncbi:hypothetical protein DFS34DRAFT_255017 [Phlyctochytrium arcticum]|nr:hypothetical protein DFS34DRAFT_255017 [Phlyctochytrium arcticum]